VSEFTDVVVRKEWIKELEPEIRDRIKLLKKRILDLNGEIDTLYEEWGGNRRLHYGHNLNCGVGWAKSSQPICRSATAPGILWINSQRPEMASKTREELKVELAKLRKQHLWSNRKGYVRGFHPQRGRRLRRVVVGTASAWVVAIPPCGLKLPLDMLYQFPTQEWPQREWLTFDTKGEIILSVERFATLRRKTSSGPRPLLGHSFFILS